MDHLESVQQKALRKACRVRVPSRTSICVSDMNEFRPGVPGGGNMGLAIDCATSIMITGDDLGGTVTSNRSPLLVHHVVDTWRSLTKSTASYEVNFELGPPEHCGLGSSASFQLCLWLGLNWLHGCPFSDNRIRILTAEHYRELDGEQVVEGFTTGLSSFLNLYGGFAIVNSRLAPVFRQHLHHWSFAVGIHPRLASTTHGTIEVELLMGEGRRRDFLSQREKQRIISDEVPLALKRGDLKMFGDAVCRLQNIGSKHAEISLHGKEIFQILDEARFGGVEVAFMSAVGPSIVLLSSRPSAFLITIAEALGLNVFAAGAVDNIGARINTIA